MSITSRGGRIRPVILAGGSGTRLWPMSTPAKPKHLLPLIGDSSLFEQTLARSRKGRDEAEESTRALLAEAARLKVAAIA